MKDNLYQFMAFSINFILLAFFRYSLYRDYMMETLFPGDMVYGTFKTNVYSEEQYCDEENLEPSIHLFEVDQDEYMNIEDDDEEEDAQHNYIYQDIMCLDDVTNNNADFRNVQINQSIKQSGYREHQDTNYYKNKTEDDSEIVDEYDNAFMTKTEERELIKAAGDSLCNGNCLPLIKQELKLKIQLKRLEKGEDELTVDFSGLADERLFKGVKKRQKVREQNRLASVRSRVRKNSREKELEEKVYSLENSNKELLKEIQELRKLKKTMKSTLDKCSSTSVSL